MADITSFANPKIKLIRKLQERKQRQKNGLYYIEGLRIIGDALQHGAVFDSVFYAPDLLHSDFGMALLDQCRNQGISVYDVSAEVFTSFANKDHPQGIAAVMQMQPQSTPVLSRQERQIWVALDAVADPGNLGTIFRTQDAAAGAGLFLLGNCTDPFDPAVLRGSMGAFYTQPFYAMSVEEFGAWKVRHKVWIVGTSDAAQKDYQAIKYPQQMVLLMGSEREGMHADTQAICDEIVSIPMAGSADSLNLSIATAVILYEIFNQHRISGLVDGGKNDRLSIR